MTPPSGREMDAWIAERLFGWTVHLPTDEDRRYCPPGQVALPSVSRNLPGGGLETGNLPAYSTTYDGLGAVIEKMRERGFAVLLAGPDLLPECWAQFTALEGKMLSWDADGATLPEAVCEAAWRSLGGGE